MEHSITKSGAAPLAIADVDQFLPPPGPWARAIGQRVVLAAGLLIVASCVLPFEQTVRASGVVRPSGDNTLVQTDQPGRVARVLVRANQLVRAGQVLAILDPRHLQGRQRQLRQELLQLQAQRNQTQAQQLELQQELSSNQLLHQSLVEASRGDVAKADASLSFARTEFQRYRDLAKVGGVPELLSQEKSANVLIAGSALRQARFGVAQQQAKLRAERARLAQELSGLQRQRAEQERQALALNTELADVQRVLANTAVRSPVDGTVVRTVLNHAGQVLNGGDVIAELSPSHAPLLVKALVPAKDVAMIRPQQLAYLRVSACPFSRFGLLRGRVRHIAADTTASAGRTDEPAGSFYELTIQPGGRELRQGGEHCRLRFGMDLQADVMTRRTSIIGFLLAKLRLAAQG